MRTAIVVAAFCLCLASAALSDSADRTAVIRVVTRKFGAERPIKVTFVDVRSPFALARLTAVRKDADDLTVLLKKKGKSWTILEWGPDIPSAGRRQRVPRSLWKRWGIEDNRAEIRRRYYAGILQ